jgi:hypothetical protein
MNRKRKFLVTTPAYVVSYILIEHMIRYYQMIAPTIDIYLGRNHQFFLIFMTTAFFTLFLQVLYIILVVKNFNNLGNLTVIIVLNFIISIVTVNMNIATFNLLLFSVI